MRPTPHQDKVVPDSFRITLRQYLDKPEVKSLAPDGTPCSGTTQGLLQRATINAGTIVPVGKETDRRWEQSEDPSMIDSEIYTYDASERKRLSAIGIRRLMRESKLSQAPVSNALNGKPIRLRTLATLRQAAAKLSTT